ncbi:MAG TPA: gluconate 2-dehydrogenase subunit 3 family protein [Candidatus Eisenbacteria bacterium]|nr:gluconate 2-dehydrogenase subunit 3 family protein [Candidatus Eisenbacteria bacterium]
MTDSDQIRDAGTHDDLTRRQWILRLGELVALAGVSGVVPEFATLVAGQEPATTGLPPGLYEPSQDHLVHALSSAGKNWTPPPGSETDYVLPGSDPYRPQFFTAEEFLVATRLLEILLGNVNPGAVSQAAQWFDLYLHSAAEVRTAVQNLDPMHRVLAVEFFGRDAVRELEASDPQSVARSGLVALRQLSTQTYGTNFLQLSEKQQIELITTAGKSQPQSDLRKLYDLARTEAIRGYYTSAEGLKELDYRGNAFYGDSPGCTPKP